jgi:hypothetical protein
MPSLVDGSRNVYSAASTTGATTWLIAIPKPIVTSKSACFRQLFKAGIVLRINKAVSHAATAKIDRWELNMGQYGMLMIELPVASFDLKIGRFGHSRH